MLPLLRALSVARRGTFGRALALSFLAVGSALLLGACEGGGVVDDGDDEDAVLELETLAEGLTAPVLVREAPDETGRLFVVDQIGVIRIITADGTLLGEPFLDLRDAIVDLRTDFDERGLLGLAFHPQFASNGRFFVYYSAALRAGAPADFNHTSHISEFTVSAADPDRADRASERIVLQVDQPQGNHNGGTVSFGPEGFLYISIGDGGGANDVGNGHVADWYPDNAGGNGQDVEQNLLGNILRIDVDAGVPYAIPATNPFVGIDGQDEIWAFGFRNPYRFSFDLQTGALLVGDAGQNRWEEVSLVVGPNNFGWNVKEGTHCFDAEDPTADAASCPEVGQFGEPLIDPVIEYANANNADTEGLGLAVVGGFIYRGEEVPGLIGQYVFGDFSRSFSDADGVVFVAAPQAGVGLWSFEELRFGEERRALGAFLLGFGQDLDGEIYVLTSTTGAPTGSTGQVHRLILQEATASETDG